jgi:hypothetical protein
MTIIALTGKKQAGKDTAASVLVADYGFRRLAFADRLRELALERNPLLSTEGGGSIRLSLLVEMFGWEEAKKVSSVRLYLQDFGQHIKEEIDDAYWSNYVFARVDAEPNVNWVLTDTRFPVEIRDSQARGGYIVRVDRPGLPDDDLHPSEWAWRDTTPDYVLLNDGDRESFQQRVAGMMADLEPRGWTHP